MSIVPDFNDDPLGITDEDFAVFEVDDNSKEYIVTFGEKEFESETGAFSCFLVQHSVNFSCNCIIFYFSMTSFQEVFVVVIAIGVQAMKDNCISIAKLYIQTNDRTSVQRVTSASTRNVIYKLIVLFILERDHFIALSVIQVSPEKEIWTDTLFYTLVQDPMPATFAAQHSLRSRI